MQMGRCQKSPLKCKNSTFSLTKRCTLLRGPEGQQYSSRQRGPATMGAEWSQSAGPLSCCHGVYIILFTYLWLHWVLAALRAFSSCGEWGLLYSCGARASRCSGSSRSGAQPQ